MKVNTHSYISNIQDSLTYNVTVFRQSKKNSSLGGLVYITFISCPLAKTKA